MFRFQGLTLPGFMGEDLEFRVSVMRLGTGALTINIGFLCELSKLFD